MSIYSDVVEFLQTKAKPIHYSEVSQELGYPFAKIAVSHIQFMRYHSKDSLFTVNHIGLMSLTLQGELFDPNSAYVTRCDVNTQRDSSWIRTRTPKLPVAGFEIVKLGMDILAMLAMNRRRINELCSSLEKCQKEVDQAISVINTRLSPVSKAMEAVISHGSYTRDFLYKINEHGYTLLTKWDVITNIEDEDEAATKIKRFCDGFISD